MTTTTRPDSSEIIISNGATAFVGKDAISLVRAAHLKAALNLYAKSGLCMTRTASPTRMLDMAAVYTGKTYKRGQFAQAAADVKVWLDEMRDAIPTTDNRTT